MGNDAILSRGMKKKIAQNCTFVTSAPNLKALPPALKPEVAFWGRSNVGKSSLLNALVNRRQLARTSNTPGRTQAIQFYNMPWFMIVDLPGYGYASVPIALKNSWQTLVMNYLQNRPSLWKIYLLLDSRHPLQPLDKQAIGFLKLLKKPYDCVFTKIDCISQTVLSQRLASFRQEFPNQNVWTVSSKTKEGIKLLFDDLPHNCSTETSDATKD